MGTRFVLIEKFFKEIWKGCLNSTFMPHLSQATICPLNTDFSILLFMQLNALLMSLYPYMYGSWGPRLAGSIQLSSAWRNVTLHCWAHLRFIEVLQALHVASRWWHHARLLFLLLFCFLFLSLFFCISVLILQSHHPNKNTRHSSSAQTHTHVSVLIQLITQTFHC